MLAVVLTVVDDDKNVTSAGASIETLIVPGVYPDPPAVIFTSSTLPPFAKDTSPTAVPALNATVGAPV